MSWGGLTKTETIKRVKKAKQSSQNTRDANKFWGRVKANEGDQGWAYWKSDKANSRAVDQDYVESRVCLALEVNWLDQRLPCRPKFHRAPAGHHGANHHRFKPTSTARLADKEAGADQIEVDRIRLDRQWHVRLSWSHYSVYKWTVEEWDAEF